MLTLTNICKDYASHASREKNRVLHNISFSLQKGEKLGIIGHNGAGKSTLIRMIAGVELPTIGKVERGMSVSWPVGLNGAFAPGLTGNDNIRFIARIYGKPVKYVCDYVDDFAELGSKLSEPVRSYSHGMRARLNFALSLAIDFDCYLVDEILAVGDARFTQRSHEELFAKRADRSLILASHDSEVIRSYCSRALMLYRGHAKMFDDINLALDIYNDLRPPERKAEARKIAKKEEEEEEDNMLDL